MTADMALDRVARPSRFADGALKSAAAFWFLIALAGQWIFVLYIGAFYYPATLQGDFEAWSRNKMLIHGYVAGDTPGNLAFAAHVLMAAVITFGGTLQIIPQLRARAIAFHRWNGRVFIATAFAISLAGFFLNATRETPGAFNQLAISLNGLLIMFCAAQTIGFAMARDIDTHRRWALRTFLLVNGVWFLRVGFIGWMAVKVGVFGGAMELDTDFFAFWSYGSYLVPLAVLELYFLAQKRGAVAKTAMAAMLLVLTLAMGAGIAGATMMIWWPLIAAA